MKKLVLTAVLAFSLATSYANVNPTNPTTATSTETVLSSELTPFCKAIVLGKVDLVKQMIALGEDVNQKSLGKTPAMFAARYNHAEILELLINNGADLSTKSDTEKLTAAQFAKISKAADAIEVLSKK